MRWRKEFLSSCEIPLTAVECIWSWVRQCPLLPAFSYKGPTLCPGAPSEPANGHSSGYTYAGRFMSWLWCFVSVCVYLGFALECGPQNICTGQSFYLLLEFGDAVGEGGEGLHDQSFILCLHGLVLLQLRYQQLNGTHKFQSSHRCSCLYTLYVICY